ncbi:MAG TPA: branched chain amino acid aminotransferase, partial [Phycicoccus sp.]|nr:branched chain amino acid aminotransferase [Phycicoccus sp.]
MSLSFSATPNPNPVADARRAEILAAPGFGQFMTDHMLKATWSDGEGWHSGELTAYGNISISPASSVLHYAPEIFEGLKAYRHEDGSVWT